MRKDLIITALLTFCLAGVLFTAIPTRSQETLEYDPWKDINDDGKLDILDIVQISSQYGAAGTPINKTALLLELLMKIEQLNATVIQQQSIINNLSSIVTYLNVTVVFLNNTRGLGPPDYDSGWTQIDMGQTLTFQHGLGTVDVFVYLVGNRWLELLYQPT